MALESNNRYRQLTMSDLEPGKEFVIAQTISVARAYRSDYQLRVGDVIKIHECNELGIAISVNGHLTKPEDRLQVPIDEVGDFTVNEE